MAKKNTPPTIATDGLAFDKVDPQAKYIVRTTYQSGKEHNSIEPAPRLSPEATRQELLDFASNMEKKLRKNDHKGGWRHLPDDMILKLLQGEVIELEVALKYESPEAVMNEAADVANFALFLWDKARLLAKRNAKA